MRRGGGGRGKRTRCERVTKIDTDKVICMKATVASIKERLMRKRGKEGRKNELGGTREKAGVEEYAY